MTPITMEFATSPKKHRDRGGDKQQQKDGVLQLPHQDIPAVGMVGTDGVGTTLRKPRRRPLALSPLSREPIAAKTSAPLREAASRAVSPPELCPTTTPLVWLQRITVLVFLAELSWQNESAPDPR